MTDASGQSESSRFSKKGSQSRPVPEILLTRACWVVTTAGVGAQVPATGRGRDGGSSKLYSCGAIVVVLSLPVRQRRERMRREMRPVLELGGRSGEEPAHRRGPCCCCCRSLAGAAGSPHSGSSCGRGRLGGYLLLHGRGCEEALGSGGIWERRGLRCVAVCRSLDGELI